MMYARTVPEFVASQVCEMIGDPSREMVSRVSALLKRMVRVGLLSASTPGHQCQGRVYRLVSERSIPSSVVAAIAVVASKPVVFTAPIPGVTKYALATMSREGWIMREGSKPACGPSTWRRTAAFPIDRIEVLT